MLAGLIIALVIAAVLSWIFVSVVGWRRHGEPTDAGPGGALLFFFLVVFLTSWVASLFLDPVGPPIAGVSWLGTLFAAFFVALILAAAIPPRRDPAEDPAREADAETEAKAVTFSVFFWILAVGLMVLLALSITA